MKTFFTSFVLSLLAFPLLFGQNSVEFNASASWIGFMNVSDLPEDGGAYQFGSFWGIPDLKSTLDVGENTLTLQPNFNTYAANPTDPFWVDQSTGEGKKMMEASTFVEPANSNDADFTFSGSIVSNTLAEGYTAKVFIKALDSLDGYSDALGGSKVIDVPASGDFSVSATAAELPTGLIVQYGFSITGPNANPADEATLGSVVVTGEMMTSSPNNVLFSANDSWIGFMNVSDLPAAGGAYQFGSAWEVPALKSTLDTDGNTLTLQPNFNTYADNATDPFWVDQSSGEGNKQMEALTFVEPGVSFNGADLSFTGHVQSYTLAEGCSAKYFIKALNPDDGFQDALGGSGTFDIPQSGEFTVSVPGSQLSPGLIIQYGFSITGPNANPANEDALGTIVIGAEAVSTNDLADLSATYYPNPAQDYVVLKAEKEMQTLTIFNLQGRQVYTEQLGQSIRTIDIASLPAGVYVLKVQIDGQIGTAQLIKQ